MKGTVWESAVLGHSLFCSIRMTVNISGATQMSDLQFIDPFQTMLDRQYKEGIVIPLCIDESEWCNSFVTIQKPSGTHSLCIDKARLNKIIMRPIHRSTVVNDLLQRLLRARCFSIIKVKSGHWRDTNLSYFTTLSCPFGHFSYL